MKKIIFLLITMIVCVNTNASVNTTIKIDAVKAVETIAKTTKKVAEHNDIALDKSIPVKVVEDVTTNSKGKQVTKYYCVIKGELYSTSKSVAEYIYLCERLQVTPKLAIRDNKKVIKL